MENGGEVLAGAIDKYCYLTLRWLPPFFAHKYRIVYGQMENVHSHLEIQHPAVRAIFDRYPHTGGIELHHDGDLPARSGIGSSASFAVGLLHAMRLLLELPVNNWDLATEAIDIEQQVLNETTGSQDQITCALGGFHHLKFQEDGNVVSERSQLLSKNTAELNEWLVLIYSGVQRSSHEISQTLTPSFRSNATLMNELMSLVREGKALIERGGYEAMRDLGSLLHQSWLIKGALNPKAISPEVGDLYDRGIRAGAVGGKVSGAGGGGFLVFAVPPEERINFLQNLGSEVLHVPFSFVQGGSEAVFIDSNATRIS